MCILTKTWLKFGSTAIGVKTSEGVVLGVEKKLPSKLMEPTKSEKLVEVRKRFNKWLLTIFLRGTKFIKLFAFIFIDRQTLRLRYEWYCW